MSKIADILEIFSSIQGEGPYMGERQIFVRFADCNLDCTFCDVPKNVNSAKLNVKEVVSKIKRLNKDIRHKAISLTGGEPLLQIKFLKELLPRLKSLKFKIYLETNATLSKELKEILKYIDIISADIKLPSVTEERPCWRRHLDFVRLGRKKDIFVKTVVSNGLKMDDFKKAVSLIRKIDYKIPLVIQPVMNGNKLQIGAEKLQKLQSYALRFLNICLIIPQVHKIIGAR